MRFELLGRAMVPPVLGVEGLGDVAGEHRAPKPRAPGRAGRASAVAAAIGDLLHRAGRVEVAGELQLARATTSAR